MENRRALKGRREDLFLILVALGRLLVEKKQRVFLRLLFALIVSPRFQSGSNPAGLAVTNTIDEPRGLRDVPNFADPDIMSRTFGGGEAGKLQATLLTGSSDKTDED